MKHSECGNLCRAKGSSHRRSFAAHANLAVTVLNFDFGQFIRGQHFGQLAQKRCIDPHWLFLVIGHYRLPLIPKRRSLSEPGRRVQC